MNDVLNDALSNLEHDNYERSHKGYENRQADIALIRAALAAQPAASAEPVAWAAADTLNSPHPGCVSSLAYMSQLDKDRGREYVPLYAAPVAAQAPAAAGDARDREDAERYRLLRRKVCIAGGEFHILNLYPRYTAAPDAAAELDATIDAAMRKEDKQ